MFRIRMSRVRAALRIRARFGFGFRSEFSFALNPSLGCLLVRLHRPIALHIEGAVERAVRSEVGQRPPRPEVVAHEEEVEARLDVDHLPRLEGRFEFGLGFGFVVGVGVELGTEVGVGVEGRGRSTE